MPLVETDPAKIALGERIQTARTDASLTQETLAVQVGISRRHLIRLEKGWYRPKHELMSAIAKATNKPLAFFDTNHS